MRLTDHGCADGFRDFLIGALNNDEADTNAGQAYLWLGRSQGWTTDTDLSSADASFLGENAHDGVYTVEGVADVNGDGFDDFVVGSGGNSENGQAAGQVYLILGHAGGWYQDASLAEADASFLGEHPSDSAGGSLASVGDVNGDGLNDILLGVPHNSEGGAYAGQAYLVFGRQSGWLMDVVLDQADASFVGEAEGDWAGYSLDGTGDINGDGLDDIVIGAKRNSEAWDRAGQVYLILGRIQGWGVDTILSDADASYLGEGALDYAGWSAAGAGDVNGDGIDDVIASAGSPDTTYMVLGRETGWSMDNSLAEAGAVYGPEGGWSGWEVDGIGDVNGDGYSDFAVTSPLAGIGGYVDIIFGYPCWDADGDGVDSCSGDCNDLAAQVYPGAPEICDGLDDDCDGVIPEDEADADGDGQMICEGDCDDDNPAIYVGENEICDGLDNDCNPATDELVDADGDGFSICDGDCNDDIPEAYPGNPEVCDWIDNDCDGLLPDDELDADGDGFAICDGDCDDDEPEAHPGAVEEPYNFVDEDCDGTQLWDVDGDGYNGGWPVDDCDDENASVYPGAHEFCDDGIDNDCDGDVDEEDDDCPDLDDDDSADDDTTDDMDDDDSTDPQGDDCDCRAQTAPGAPGGVAVVLLALVGLLRRTG